MGWRLAAAAMVDGTPLAPYFDSPYLHVAEYSRQKFATQFAVCICWMGGAGLVFNSAIVVPYHGREEDKAASTSWWP